MPRSPDPAVDLSRSDRRMASAWARLAVGTVVVAVPIALVLASVQSAHQAGARRGAHGPHRRLDRPHDASTTRPASGPPTCSRCGGAVVDDSGQHLTTIPAGVGLAYERSIDGSRAVVTLSDRGAEAVFDSARAAR